MRIPDEVIINVLGVPTLSRYINSEIVARFGDIRRGAHMDKSSELSTYLLVEPYVYVHLFMLASKIRYT